ncbi:MAG: hypothetical protein ABJA78_18010 [Ferruginibacter sp.]
MKQLIFLSLLFLSSSDLFSQNANVTWGDEFKLKKGSTDLEVIHADNTGVYVKESHMALKAYFVIAATTRESASLIKLNKNLTELYHNDFNKELKGKEFDQLFFLKDKLFLLATDYSRKDKTLTLFAAEIDKNSGEQSGDWVEVTSWQKEEKGDDINYKVTYSSDSSKMVLVSSIEGKDHNNYEVRQFDANLKATAKPIAISNEFDPKTFDLEDVLYTSNGNVVMVGRIYEYEEGKKKKAKFLQFKNYNVRIYDNGGKQIKEINTDVAGKWLVSTKVVQLPVKELVLAAFYSNEKKGREINGMLVQRIDPTTGSVISTSQKDINTAMISALEDDNGDDDTDDESKKERKEREKLEKIQNDEEGFSKYMRFRKFIYTADKGLVVLAEKYDSYTYTTTSYSGSGGFGGMGRTTSTTYQVYECGDLMMSKMDAKGNVSWLQVLPKQQREVMVTDSHSGPSTGISFYSNFFAGGYNWPFYAGFGVLPGNKNINIIFNDHKKNENVLQLGQKVRKINYYGKTNCYVVALDPITGKYTRSVLFANNDVPTAMPRLGSVLGNEFYMTGKEDRMLGKTKIAIAKISLK